MDFWDVAKLMWRRWYATVPMLLVTALATGWTTLNVAPDYEVTSHFAMVRPQTPVAEDEDEGRTTNPWTSETLAEAASIRLRGRPLAEQLEAEGHDASWSLSVTGGQPWLRLEVIAKSPTEARTTGARLHEIIEEEMQSRQDEYHIPRDEQISSMQFDDGETVEAITRSRRQAVLGVLGAGLLATMGLVLMVDAIARYRARRASAAAETRPPRRFSFAATAPRSPAAPATDFMSSSGARPQPPNGGARNLGVGSDEPATAVHPAVAADEHSDVLTHQSTVAQTRTPVGDDSTIVLPLAGQPRAGRPPERLGKNGDSPY